MPCLEAIGTAACRGSTESDKCFVEVREILQQLANQRASRRDRHGRYQTTVARDLDDHLAETGEPVIGQEPLPLAPGVHRDRLPRVIAVLGYHAPAPGKLVHVAYSRQ